MSRYELRIFDLLEKRKPHYRAIHMIIFLQVFDTENRDFLELDEIKTIVTSYGDVFNPDETRELLRDANVRGDGNIFYAEFIDCLFNRAPELYDIKVPRKRRIHNFKQTYYSKIR